MRLGWVGLDGCVCKCLWTGEEGWGWGWGEAGRNGLFMCLGSHLRNVAIAAEVRHHRLRSTLQRGAEMRAGTPNPLTLKQKCCMLNVAGVLCSCRYIWWMPWW